VIREVGNQPVHVRATFVPSGSECLYMQVLASDGTELCYGGSCGSGALACPVTPPTDQTLFVTAIGDLTPIQFTLDVTR
jgi:hypothetical protein